MAPRNQFNSLHVSKRSQQSSFPAFDQDSEDEYISDMEKRLSTDSVDYSSPISSSSYSSRASSGVHRPMMPRRQQSARKTVSAYSYRNPRAFSRYFSLALGSTVIIFILMLTKAGWSSSKQVSVGFESPPAAPVWEKFPFLKRYHGGIRTLILREDNVPEYPPQKSKKRPPTPQKQPESAPNEASAVIKGRAAQLPSSEPFNPYPDYSSTAYKNEYGDVVRCFLDEDNNVAIPMVHAYRGVPKGTPDNLFGSYDLLGLRNDICFERFGRLGPYGLGYSKKIGGTGASMNGDRDGAENVWEKDREVDYRKINWSEAQKRCLEANKHRFKQPATTNATNSRFLSMNEGNRDDSAPAGKAQSVQRRQFDIAPDVNATSPALKEEQVPKANSTAQEHSSAPQPPEQATKESTQTTPEKAPSAVKHLPRTAVVIRTWSDYEYDEEDILNLRSMIAELSLLSSGEYTVHFLVHVKDDDLQIWSDKATYDRVLRDSLPEEFRGMGTLWSNRQMFLIYGGMDETVYRDLPVYGVYRSTYLPVQYFAHQHPEYEFLWHWEMDARYIGNWYHFFDRIGKWSKEQPRKELWERNHRFYIPSLHGVWSKFRDMVHVKIQDSAKSRNSIYQSLPHNAKIPPSALNRLHAGEKIIWGPERPLDDKLDTSDDPVPPTETDADDDYEWGVGEDADFITLSPLFDPQNTGWLLASDVTGYNTSRGLPPRRSATITGSRLSRRLLNMMHKETALSRHHMFSEMWPGTVALHHGLKAVYAPHPVYIDRNWDPVQFVEMTFNAGPTGASGGVRNSVFSEEYQHNFKGTTWFYNSGFAPNLWMRWLGQRVDNDGGEDHELAGEGRMCLPSVLLHPVKHVDWHIELPPPEESDLVA